MNKMIQRDPNIVRMAVWYAGILALSLPLTAFSLYGQLWGPRGSMILGIMGFVLALPGFILSRHPLGARFLQECPAGLSGPFLGLASWRKRIERVLAAVSVAAFLSIVAMFASSRKAGVPADTLPVFAPREHYVLTNHGRRTEVSPARFWIAAAGGDAGWHCGTMYATMLALYSLLYGKLPATLQRGKKIAD